MMRRTGEKNEEEEDGPEFVRVTGIQKYSINNDDYRFGFVDFCCKI